METYSSHPFISHDGIDSQGVRAEVRVVMGYGKIHDVEESEKGKASNVTFKVENTKWKSSGYAPNDSNVMKKIQEAQDLNVPIHFRIETTRKKGVDRGLPISEISTFGSGKTFKSLAAVRLEGEDEWTISPRALTRFDEDPIPDGPVSANSQPLEKLQASKGGDTKRSNNRSNNGKFREAPPYATYNDDGSLNYGSMAVSVPLNLYSYVTEYVRNNPDAAGLTDKSKIVLSRLMLSMSNDIQMGIYESDEGKLEKPDLSAGSHTRARALVFETIRTFYPITTETVASKESLKEWRDNVVDKSLAMYRWSVAEIKKLEEID